MTVTAGLIELRGEIFFGWLLKMLRGKFRNLYYYLTGQMNGKKVNITHVTLHDRS
jgi:hypothetical protein